MLLACSENMSRSRGKQIKMTREWARVPSRGGGSSASRGGTYLNFKCNEVQFTEIAHGEITKSSFKICGCCGKRTISR